MNKSRVLIVGAGRLGQALAQCLRRGQQSDVSLWDSRPALVPGSLPLPTLAHTADVVLLAVPTSSVRSVLSDVGLHLPSRTMFGLLSKGLEDETGLAAAEIAEKNLPPQRGWAVIGGPMVAEELRTGVRGRAIVAGPAREFAHILQALFPPETMEITASSAEAREISLAGVLKNVYAALYGVGVGLGWSPVELSRLWQRCEAELILAGTLCGIQTSVMSGLAGLEDFRATGGSPHSRNRQAGMQLVTSHALDLRAEGIHALPYLAKRFPKLRRLECFHGLAQTIESHGRPRDLRSLMLEQAAAGRR